ncbi:sulfotransferase domain-containing protein [Halomicronema sp. CCY15110]|uniref:sulfotransferase domain-containing protein n=1 Tax=Halomicronema sp. CCY15110 TaxID=2767773 RepID=UPI001950C27A|nr:sulfotransferase domain-containing protein [Halomicronema sp. CCY15110]
MTMPNFLLIGAAKSGTSSLYYYLKQHPDIFMPASRDQKEPDFFTLEGQNQERIGPFGPFLMKSAITDLDTYQQLFADVNGEKAIGEASTSYIYSQTAAQRIHSHVPDAKIVAILRDPAERAYSHFLFSLSNGREPHPNFEKALKEEQQRIDDGWSFQWHHRRRGFYFEQLERYYATFGASNVYVCLYEDLRSEPQKLLKSIFEFLEVDNSFLPNTNKRHNPTKVPKNQTLNSLLNKPNPLKDSIKHFLPKGVRKKITQPLKDKNLGKPELPKRLRQELIADYHDDILKLQELIDRDLSSWLEV